MNLKKLLLTVTILTSAYAMGYAQINNSETNIDIQLRSRGEYRNGSIQPRSEETKPATFINNRARLSLNYSSSWVEVGASAQYFGVWGQDAQIDTKRIGTLAINEAWGKLKFGESCFAKLGRQTLVYDDERILGALDWKVEGRSHDVLKLGYENSANKLHLVLGYNQNSEGIHNSYYTQSQPYKAMQMLWYQHKSSSEPFWLSAIFMNLGSPNVKQEDGEYSKSYQMQTTGLNLGYNESGLNLSGSLYYQFGKSQADQDVNAWMISLNGAYKFNNQWAFGLGTDYISGDKQDDAKKKRSFDLLYGTHHKFYGWMDYFYASPFVNVTPGLWDKNMKLTFTPSNIASFAVKYHHFSTAVTYADPQEATANLKKSLGSEVDIHFAFKLMKDVKLEGGYSMMFGTKTMDYVKGGDHKRWQDWGWLSLNINPRIFSSAW